MSYIPNLVQDEVKFCDEGDHQLYNQSWRKTSMDVY